MKMKFLHNVAKGYMYLCKKKLNAHHIPEQRYDPTDRTF